MDILRKNFLEAMDSSGCNAEKKRILREAIHAIDYVKEFFAGTSQLPPLEENYATMWGKTFDLLKVAFGNIIEAEKLLENGFENGLELTNSRGNSGKKQNADESKRKNLPGNGDIHGCDLDSGNDMSQSYHSSSGNAEEDMESVEDSDDLLLGLFLGLGM